MAGRPLKGWARHNARQNEVLRGELGDKGWVEGRVVNPNGTLGGYRSSVGKAAILRGNGVDGQYGWGGQYGALTGTVAISVRMEGLPRIRAMLERAEKLSPAAVARALNRTAERARTDITRALVKQTGLKFGRIRSATSLWRASAGSLQAEIKAKGGYTSLKEFSARRTAKGVSAAPWGRRQVFDGTFIVRRYGGHVYKREGARRFPIQKLYGPAIPVEMVKGQSLAAFNRAVEAELPKRLEHELGRIFGR
ncbi:phage tail protein [Xanthobacter flavus]|uniref:phage tail protein n=1 Tax=Xanthobacter flavus TaxID=281 RepID=UPI001AE43E9A|nr:phage tail protein [Xanthobacter flavus]MBP2147943.1 hypothetical protein [Xanthobacter flavus]